jgi:hypothetical protein
MKKLNVDEQLIDFIRSGGDADKVVLTLKQIKEQLNYGDIAECSRQLRCSAQTVHNLLNGKSRKKYIYAWLNERALENMKIPKK